MRRPLCIAFAACLAAAAHAQQQDITIRGTIEGLSSGRLLLVAQTGENKTDTLGSAPFNTPRFTLKCTLKEPMPAQIMVQGYTGGFTFIAEPGHEYTALLKNGGGAYIRGGRLNDEWQAFIRHQTDRRAEADTLRAHYEAAKAQGKFRSASRANDSLQARLDLLQHETDSFFACHDDIIASFTAYSNATMRGLNAAECQALYDRLGNGAKNTVSARLLKERIERMRKSEMGGTALDFTLPTLTEGQTLTLSKVKAKIKIVDFWASWCGPCRLNNPSLRAIYNDFHPKGLEIVSVSLDTKRAAWAAAVEKDQLPWLHASSLKGWKCDVTRQYNVTAVPAIFVLDEHDRIIATNLRGDKLRAFLEERLR